MELKEWPGSGKTFNGIGRVQMEANALIPMLVVAGFVIGSLVGTCVVALKDRSDGRAR
jgi:hypothetical protein